MNNSQTPHGPRSNPSLKLTMTRTCMTLPALTLLVALVNEPSANAQDFAQAREQVRALGDLTAAPAIHPADGIAAQEELRPLFFEGLPYRGKPTRVFAWYGARVGQSVKLPAMVLV